MEMLSVFAGDQFPALGSGSGYAVRLESLADNLIAGYVVGATSTESGFSPAQSDGVSAAEASPTIAWPYLRFPQELFAALVVINLGNADGQVWFYAYQDGMEVGRTVLDAAVNHPVARSVEDLFPGVEGDFFAVAQGDQPIVGVAFLFNEKGEPSMSNTVPIESLPPISQ